MLISELLPMGLSISITYILKMLKNKIEKFNKKTENYKSESSEKLRLNI